MNPPTRAHCLRKKKQPVKKQLKTSSIQFLYLESKLGCTEQFCPVFFIKNLRQSWDLYYISWAKFLNIFTSMDLIPNQYIK